MSELNDSELATILGALRQWQWSIHMGVGPMEGSSMTERYELPPNLPVEQLLALAEELGLEPADLGDAVHDLAQEVGLAELNSLEEDVDQDEHITTQEVRASDINNSGLESQVAFLLEHNGHEDTRRLLEQAAAEKS